MNVVLVGNSVNTDLPEDIIEQGQHKRIFCGTDVRLKQSLNRVVLFKIQLRLS
jgi:hypothetical protein